MTLAIEIQHLKKVYANDHQALKGIDLTVNQGDFFALLGQNGAGKSTTIGILTSLIVKTAGSIKVLGYDFDEQPSLVKSFLGVVPQEVNLNIFETVERTLWLQAGYYGIPKKIAEARAKTLLQTLELWDKRKQTIRMLSGGMKRRLMIARALVHQPKILILDEPTAGVDVEIREAMWEFLRALNREGTTIILTTHYLEEAEMLCNRLAMIDQGKIIRSGATRELLDALEFETIVLHLIAPIMEDFILRDFNYRLMDSKTLEVDLHSRQNLSELFKQLNEQGVAVASMKNKMSRLQQLYVNLLDKRP